MTVTVCFVDPFVGVKVRLAGLTVPSAVLEDETPMVTIAAGAPANSTVKGKAPPDSDVLPLAGVTITRAWAPDPSPPSADPSLADPSPASTEASWRSVLASAASVVASVGSLTLYVAHAESVIARSSGTLVNVFISTHDAATLQLSVRA